MTARGDGDSFLFTSESVGEGHPDKMCDQISDAVLDACFKQDPLSKVACETATKDNNVILLGEISSKAVLENKDFEKIIRDTVKQIGFDDIAKGIDYKTCNIQVLINAQSAEIADSVHVGKSDEDLGAGDQGLMFGYATDETDQMMPLTVVLSHALNKRMADCRRDGTLGWLRPDSKSQVTVEYVMENGSCVPKRVHTIVISTQHDDGITVEHLREKVMECIVKPAIPAKYLDKETKYWIQPSGSFIVGGPQGDAGLTGRKIIVDTYGGWGAHGGGAFSGKDPSKVDRSAAYAGRWIAKSLVAAGLAKRVLIQISYSIGIAEPLAIDINTYGTGSKSNKELLEIVNKNFDLRPGMIIKELDLRKPIYQASACYGHFGRPEFSWEQPKKLVF